MTPVETVTTLRHVRHESVWDYLKLGWYIGEKLDALKNYWSVTMVHKCCCELAHDPPPLPKGEH